MERRKQEGRIVLITATASSSGGAYMIKRNPSLTRVEGLAEQLLGQPSVPRRRSPLVKTPNGSNDNTRTDLLPPGFRSPPGSPRRNRSLSPGRRSGAAGKVRGGWPRASTGIPLALIRAFRMALTTIFSSRGGMGGGGSINGAQGEGSQDPSDKGPKRFFRLRAVSLRKAVALVAIGLCVVAGGRRLFGFSAGESSPKLRGVSKWGGVAQVLPAAETPYCSAPLHYPAAQAPTTEGGGKGAAAPLELRQLQITIRHGDRSVIHDIPGADEQKWRCLPFAEDVQQKWEGVDRFHVENVDGRALKRSFIPAVYTAGETALLGKAFKGQGGRLCKQGQLTEIGIRQHLTLGEHMRKAYAKLLGGELQQDQIYVRSTDYTRTLESAAAFLMSFFPGSSGMTIITDEDENGEVMHGVGLKGSSKGSTGGQEKVVVGACDRAASLSTTQNGGFKPRADVVSDLTGLFGEGLADWKMTEIGDALHARSCHNMTLPCSDKGCVSPVLALSVMSEADRQMCMKYVGAAGGGEAAALSLYPFTSEILNNMRDVLSGKSATKFALFSGHDTVVAPLLAALGAYDCRWPPYASHVAFELWSKPSQGKPSQKKKKKGKGDEDNPARRTRRALLGEDEGGMAGDAREFENVGEALPSRDGGEGGEAGAGVGTSAKLGGRLLHEEPNLEEEGGGGGKGGRAGKDKDARERAGEDGGGEEEAGGEGEEEEKEEAYVRVTFNGRPVTHRITDCKDLEGPYGADLCPLSRLAKTIGRAIAPHNSLEEACQDFDSRHP